MIRERTSIGNYQLVFDTGWISVAWLVDGLGEYLGSMMVASNV